VKVTDLAQLFPRDFLKVSCGSLEGICNSPFRAKDGNSLDLDEFDGEYEIDADFSGSRRLIRLKKDGRKKPVYGIDTSNISLGETAEGILLAFRGSISWRENGIYQYVRHGPFIFHVTERNKQELYTTLLQLYYNAGGRTSAPILEMMGTSIRDVLERWLQKQVCISSRRSLILWDGSLT